MKFFLLILTILLGIISKAQTYEIRTHYISDSKFAVQMRCTSEPHPTTNNYILDIVFGVKWQDSYDVDLGSATGDYNIAKSDIEKVKNSYEWQAFYANNTPYTLPNDWVIDEWQTIAILPISKKSTTQSIGTFEINEVGFDPTTNLNINIDGTDFTPTINGMANNVVIPISLTSFTAKKHNNSSSYLSWTTEDEVNFDRFEIERSSGYNDWEYIGTVKGSGQERGKKSYSYIDLDVYDNVISQTFYYRLKMVDLDGKYKFSQEREVFFENADRMAKLLVFPNPATEKVFFTLSNIKKDSYLNIKIYDNVGKLALSKNIFYQNNKNLLIDNSVQRLHAGVYNVIVSDKEGHKYFKKLVLTR